MELSDFIEFKQLKNVKFAVNFRIELKEFRHFKKPFFTDKYLNICQWEEITRKVMKVAERKIKTSIVINDEKEEAFEADESFNVKCRFVPKEQTYIDFRKLNFMYDLNWIMIVEISRISSVNDKTNLEMVQINNLEKLSPTRDFSDPAVIDPYLQIHETPKCSPIKSDSLEYDPSPPTPNKARNNLYIPSTKNIAECKSPPGGYSPQSLNHNYKVTPNMYTPSKIGTTSGNRDEEIPSSEPEGPSPTIYEQLFGDDDSGHEMKVQSLEKTEQRISSRQRKRGFVVPEQREVSTVKLPKNKRPKKIKTPSASSEKTRTIKDCWVSVNRVPSTEMTPVETPSKITQRRKERNEKKAKETKTTVNNIDDEGYQKINAFLIQSKQEDEDKDKRRLELENYEMWNCNDLTNIELKQYVKEFAPKAQQYLQNCDSLSLRNSKYDPVMFTTSNILTEDQCHYVLQQIEKLRNVKDRGQNEAVLTDKILPEFIIHVFCEKFNLTREKALERLAVQVERQALFCNFSCI